MATSNTIGRLTTVFSTSPYYDDFDVEKNFHRILYKPSVAVQARELTQSQAIQQEQIKRFAEHIFDEGSIVSGGEFKFPKNIHYIKIKDTNSEDATVNINDFVGKRLTGANKQVTATVYDIADGTEGTSEPKTLFIVYNNTGSDNTTKVFAADEEIVDSSGHKATILSSGTNPIGKSAVFSINSGILFAKGHFIRFDSQKIILSKYDQNPTALVGFKVHEDIITFEEDYTLLDPAQGSYNYAAPGADRLALTVELVKYAIDETNIRDFTELFHVSGGVVQEKFNKTQYSLIRDELARRTFDESGDYYVTGLNVNLREHLDTGDNNGYLAEADGGNSNKLAVGVSPGVAYVKGYDIERLVTTYIPINKGTSTEQADNQPVTVNYGNYIFIDEVVGSWDANFGSVISLYDTAQNRISDKIWSTSAQTGNLIGTAKLRAIEPYSGVQGTSTARYKLYIYDVKMTNGSFSSVKSVYLDNTNKGDACGDTVLVNNYAVLYDTKFRSAIYPITNKSVKTLRNSNNNLDLSYDFYKSFDINIASNGTFSVNTGNVDNVFNYSIGTLNNDQKNNFLVSLNSTISVAVVGVVSTTSGQKTITGSGTYFTKFNVGDVITITGVTGSHIIETISSNTLMTVTVAVTATVTSATFTKKYYAGTLIDFSGKGYTGTDRSISIDSSTTASFDMKETLSTSCTGTVICKLTKTAALEAKKILKSKRYVKISCATAGTTGPFNLGISDVYRINSIRRSTSAFTTATQGVDVTSQFVLDKGQKDDLYDHGRIILRNGTLTTSNYLLIELDYFAPSYTQGVGFFSVDSYPVDDTQVSDTTIKTEEIPLYTSPVNGKVYDLRMCIDTRAVKVNTAADATTVGAASTNPALTEDFVYPTGGLTTPVVNENFSVTYMYYMGRKDLVVLNKDGLFRVVSGIPSLNPITPSVPSDSMSLATLTILPYPSLSSQYAATIKRLDLANNIEKTSFRRYTMRDIGVLDNRITNLEYYTALTLLEKNTLDMKVTDVNGLDRFKNGIFVDSFNSHKAGDLGNPDFMICVDTKRGEIRPLFDRDNISIGYKSGSGIKQSNGLITMDYTEKAYITQPFATDVRNTAGFFWSYKGSVKLTPSTDVWCDTTTLPSIQVTDDAAAVAMQSLATSYGTVWEDWQTISTGKKVTTNTATDGRTTTNTTTTTTTTVKEREGEKYVVDTSKDVENLGTRVVSSAIIPYMRSIPLKIFVSGMKPNTRVYAFFDNEDVTSYIVQTDNTFEESTVSNGIDDGVIVDRTKPLITGVDGRFYGIFHIPNDSKKRFTTGTKIFKLTDSFNNGVSITSAETNFTAQGLTQQKQNTYLTTTYATIHVDNLTQKKTEVTTNTSVDVVINPLDPPTWDWNVPFDNGGEGEADPIAQSFMLRSEAQQIFLTGLDLYFQTKDENLGVTVQLREVDNSGYITKNVVPYSETFLESTDVNVSDTGDVATRVTFSGPICLNKNTVYAFVVLPEQSNPNYRIWTAKLGGTDVTTQKRVTKQPASGNLFVSSDSMTWSPIQDEDIKYTLYRADFGVGTGTVYMTNVPEENMRVTSITGAWDTKSEPVYGEYRLTLNNTPTVVEIGYSVTGVTSGARGTVTYKSGSVLRVAVLNGKYFGIEDIIVKDGSGNVVNFNASITSRYQPRGVFYKYEKEDSDYSILKLRGMSGNLASGERLIGKYSGDICYIHEFLNKPFSILDFESSYLEFSQTSVTWGMKSTSSSNNTLDGSYRTMDVNENTTFSSERTILCRDNELAHLSGEESLQIRAILSTQNSYMSPIIDMNRTFGIIVHNIINNDYTGENGVSGGNAINKYISQKIQLADGQDAEDLKVYITAYKPTGSNIIAYAKLINTDDPYSFDQKNWIPLAVTKGETNYSSLVDENDLIEYEFDIPAGYMTGTNGEFRYTASNGVVLTGFKYFQIKLVLLGTNSAKVPRVTDLRALALQI